MPDIQDRPGLTEPSDPRRRRRRRRRRPLVMRYWWVALVVVFLFLIPSIWRWVWQPHFRPDPLAGYLSDLGKFEDEYRQFTGKPLTDRDAVQHFQQATELMLAGSYGNAAITLEGVAKVTPVPMVFNDLAVLYARLNDGEHSVRAFRDALARSHDYAPALENIRNLKLNIPADPGSNELEPNNSTKQANVVWMDRPIEGVIDAASHDPDYFWFSTPRPPRDRIAIEVLSKSPTLTPQLLIYDSAGKTVVAVRQASTPGGSVRVDLAPAANTSFYLQITGVGGSTGAYALSVSSLRAYDVFEPNDTPLTPTRISLGQAIEANIMDVDDTDYYSFVPPAAGMVTVDMANHDPSLILRLSTYGPDRQFTGFAPDTSAGAALHHSFAVEANQIYMVQVWASGNTFGPYSMVIRQGDAEAPEEGASTSTAAPKKKRAKKR